MNHDYLAHEIANIIRCISFSMTERQRDELFFQIAKKLDEQTKLQFKFALGAALNGVTEYTNGVTDCNDSH